MQYYMINGIEDVVGNYMNMTAVSCRCMIVFDCFVVGCRYMVVDCGGGTVDITVHQVDKGEKLIELYRATGGPYGSIGKSGVDR